MKTTTKPSAQAMRKMMPTGSTIIQRELDEIDCLLTMASLSGVATLDYNYKFINTRQQVKAVLADLRKRKFNINDTYPADSMHNDLTLSW